MFSVILGMENISQGRVFYEMFEILKLPRNVVQSPGLALATETLRVLA